MRRWRWRRRQVRRHELQYEGRLMKEQGSSVNTTFSFTRPLAHLYCYFHVQSHVLSLVGWVLPLKK